MWPPGEVIHVSQLLVEVKVPQHHTWLRSDVKAEHVSMDLMHPLDEVQEVAPDVVQPSNDGQISGARGKLSGSEAWPQYVDVREQKRE